MKLPNLKYRAIPGILATLLFSIAIVSLAGAQQEAPTRITCVGDSITEGTANAEHELNSWPRILGRLLETEFPGRYETGNFGRSGATLLRKGRKPYWDEDVFTRGCEFRPQIVLINLGTNDATDLNWEHGDEFEQDYRELIGVYLGLEPRPRIWLSNLTPMYAPHPKVVECAPHRVLIEETIAQLAEEYGLGVIDFKTPTSGRSELFPDGLHPNTAGNELMAMAAFEAITGQAAPRDASIRPREVEGERHVLVADGQGFDVRLGSWTQTPECVEGTGARRTLRSNVGLDDGDFHLRARLRMLAQENSAAGFELDDNFFGFEGNRGTVFRNGPQMGGALRLLHPSESLWERDSWIDFDVIRNDGLVWFLVNGFIVEMAFIPGSITRLDFDPARSKMQVQGWSVVGGTVAVELGEEAGSELAKTGLFEAGLAGVHTYRIPALVTTNRGTLIACCDARIQSGRDLPNNIDTVMRRSTDGGRTWSDIETIVDWAGSEGTADPCLVVDRETGRIWCAVTWADGVGWMNSRPGYGDDSFHDLLVCSDDDGLSWSEPIDVTRELKAPAWRSVWFSPGAGLQAESGRLFIPFSAADGAGAVFSYAAVSDDHGATWRRVGPIGVKTNECMLAQLADGTLVCNMRSTHGLGRRAVSLSHDDGETWSALTHDETLVEPVCQASLLTVPASLTPAGREWLVFCNPASTRRERLTMRVSFDGGTTWPIERVVHAGPTAYSCMTLLPDGGIGVLYECGEGHAYEGISFAVVPLEWLASGGK